MRYSGLMQAERSVTNFCSVVTNRRPVYKQIVFEVSWDEIVFKISFAKHAMVFSDIKFKINKPIADPIIGASLSGASRFILF